MHRIGIDARLIGKTGVGVYLRNLLYYLVRLDTSGLEFYVYLLPKDFPDVNFGTGNFTKKKVTAGWHSFSEQLLLPFELYHDNLDLMHFTYFSYPILYRKPFVATIHDVTPLTFKTGKASSRNPVFYRIKHMAYQQVIRSQIANAKTIITPSRFVKNQIVERYGKKFDNKIVPIHEGVNHELAEIGGKTAQKPKRIDPGKKFFIYVGNFYPHKNVESLILAFAKVRGDVKLLLVGPDDYFSRYFVRLVDRLDLRDRILLYHNPTTADLAYFYTHALALIHPSLSEGFGLTLLEASYFQLPVIASNIPVVREILGEHFYRFDPLDTGAITGSIKAFLREKTHKNASDFIGKYSFRKMAEETLRIYRTCLH